jgi:hypothetical protein
MHVVFECYNQYSSANVPLTCLGGASGGERERAVGDGRLRLRAREVSFYVIYS